MIYKYCDYNLIVQYSLLHEEKLSIPCTQHERCGYLFCKCHKFSQSLYALPLQNPIMLKITTDHQTKQLSSIVFLRQLNCLFHNKSHQLFQTEE